ncbi:hypothetical protein D3C85_1142580 [compost metagenome]
MRGLAVIEPHVNLRNQDLLLHGDVDQAGDARQLAAQVLRQAAEGIEVVAVDLQGDLGAHARQEVVESMGNGLADGHRRRQRRKLRADRCHDRFATTA